MLPQGPHLFNVLTHRCISPTSKVVGIKPMRLVHIEGQVVVDYDGRIPILIPVLVEILGDISALQLGRSNGLQARTMW